MDHEIKQMLTGRGFKLAVSLAILGIALGSAYPQTDKILKAGQFMELEKEALCSKIVSFVLPVAAMLPWSDSFLQEWKGGFLRSALPRMQKRVYVEKKVLVVALGGCLVWMAAALAMFYMYYLIFSPMEAVGGSLSETFWPLLAVVARCAIVGSVIASLGGACGVLTRSAYLAYGLPFVGYDFCIILQERYFTEALWLSPQQWIMGTAQWGEQDRGLWLFLLLLLLVSIGVHGGILYGRLEEI